MKDTTRGFHYIIVGCSRSGVTWANDKGINGMFCSYVRTAFSFLRRNRDVGRDSSVALVSLHWIVHSSAHFEKACKLKETLSSFFDAFCSLYEKHQTMDGTAKHNPTNQEGNMIKHLRKDGHLDHLNQQKYETNGWMRGRLGDWKLMKFSHYYILDICLSANRCLEFLGNSSYYNLQKMGKMVLQNEW